MKNILPFIFLVFTINAFAQIPTDSLVAYYPFSGNANDMSGNGNDGVVHGSLLISDRFGNTSSAYFFDGIDDFINVASSEKLNSIQGGSLFQHG